VGEGVGGVVVGLLPVVVEVPEVEEPEADVEEPAPEEVEEEPALEVVEEPAPELVVELEPVALEVELEPELEPAGRVEGTGAFAQPASTYACPAAVRVRPSIKPEVVSPCCVQTTGRIEANIDTCFTK